MAVIQVVRTTPQSLVAVQMSMANAGQIAELLAKVAAPFSENTPGVMYGTKSQTGSEWADQGGWLIIFSRADHPDQMAYQGDWILVTDATYNTFDPNVERELGWILSPTSEVFVYGISTGLAGTADDFTATFTEQEQ